MIRLGLIEEDITLRSTLYIFLKQQVGVSCAIVSVSIEAFHAQWADGTFLDVVLLGPSCNQIQASDGIQAIKVKAPKCHVIVLLEIEDIPWTFQLMRKGGSTYVLELNALDRLLNYIVSIFYGELYFSPKLAKLVLDFFRTKDKAACMQYLSTIEYQLLHALHQDMSISAISKNLLISAEKQQYLLKTIQQKLIMFS